MRIQTRLSYVKTRITGRKWLVLDQISDAVLARGEERNNREAVLAARLARKRMADGQRPTRYLS